MTVRRFLFACAAVAAGVVIAIAETVRSEPAPAEPPFFAYNFPREGAATPEDAATALFRGCALRSPDHFIRHLLIGVCDGPNATLLKFAESLHTTKFHRGEEAFTVYDLPKGIHAKKPIRVVASRPFELDKRQAQELQIQGISTYYGRNFRTLDVAGEGYDGLEYSTRIVVAEVRDGWYAVPRCRSSRFFYEIADAMPAVSEANDRGM